MNSSNNSSFSPLDYYKQLTHHLANRKNLKINLSRIPGSREFTKVKRAPFMTNQIIQSKFLAKYNERCEKREIEKPIEKPKSRNEVNFKLKTNQVGTKRKLKENENNSYFNLPATFFKSYNGPDLSVFKVPEVPQNKRQKMSSNESRDRSLLASNSSNFTLASLFSGNFKPPRSSTPFETKRSSENEIEAMQTSILEFEKPETPVEKQQVAAPIIFENEKATKEFFEAEKVQTKAVKIQEPEKVTMKAVEKVVVKEKQAMISDPSEMLKQVIAKSQKRKRQREKSIQEDQKDRENIKVKKYLDVVDKAAKRLDSLCFLKVDDPVKNILNKLNSFHEIASQSPRASLLSQGSSRCRRDLTPSFNRIRGIPIPVFYDEAQTETKKPASETSSVTDFESLFGETYDLFEKRDTEKDEYDEARSLFNFNFDPSPSINFSSMLNSHVDEDQYSFLFDTPRRDVTFESFIEEPMSCASIKYQSDDDIAWLEESFNSSMNMDWESDFNLSPIFKDSNDNTAAIFRSPPNSRNMASNSRINLQRRFAKTINQPLLQQEASRVRSNFFDENRDEDDDSVWWRKNFPMFDHDEPLSPSTFAMDESTNIFNNSFNIF